jgi:hypothetical protein
MMGNIFGLLSEPEPYIGCSALKEEEYFWLCTAPSWGTQWHSG